MPLPVAPASDDYLYRESGVGYPDFRFDDLVGFILDNQDNFFDNVTAYDWKVNDEVTIPKGMKLLRAFKYFCKDKDLLNDIQSVASMAIQNDKITGILCMSVHPFDYLSVSENIHNWRSCHALDGEYRAGNLNYMADPTTVVCYLKSSHKAALPRFPEDIKWNSKKWRVLLFFNETYDFMMAGRQYPFFEDSLLLPIKKEVERMFDRKFSGWFNQYIRSVPLTAFMDDEDESLQYDISLSKKYIPVANKLLSFRKFVSNGDGTLQFNDLLDSSTYEDPYYSFGLVRGWRGDYYHDQYFRTDFPKIKVGKKCNCLECNNNPITMSESFLCNHCMIKEGQADDNETFGTCQFCGVRFVLEEGHTYQSVQGYDYPICADCFNVYKEKEGYTVCNNCERLIPIEICKDGVCEDCYDILHYNGEPFVVRTVGPVQMFNSETGELVVEFENVTSLDDFVEVI